MIDPRDIADVAAVALSEPVARELVLTGRRWSRSTTSPPS
jgi:hypothetical protein